MLLQLLEGGEGEEEQTLRRLHGFRPHGLTLVFDTCESGRPTSPGRTTMAGFSCSRSWLVVLLLCTLWVLAAAAAAGPERGGRSQRRGGGEKRRKLHRLHHGECSYTFLLPELAGCPAGGPPSRPELNGGSRGGVQRDSPPIDGEWSARKLQHLESQMENNTQWLQKVRSFSFSSRRWAGMG